MRLGFDGKRATQNFRGLGNYSRGLIEGLLQYSNEELFLYSPVVNDKRAKEWLDSQEKSKDRFHLKIPETFLEQKLSSLWRSFSIVGDLRKEKLDLYHGLSHELPIGISGIPLKSVVTIHDLIFLRYPDFFPFIDRVVYKQKFTYATQNADMVIAICEQTKRDLIEYLGVDAKKIVVHYQSCDPRFYVDQGDSLKEAVKEKYKLDRPFVLNVGAFEARKNQKTLIQAFAKSFKNFEHDLILIGAGKTYRAECIALAAELKLGDRIKFLSGVPHIELPAIYQMSSMFCFPSIFEGFGIPIIEALFSKTPVLTSLGSCFPESAGPSSEYIDPLSIDEIAIALTRILGDKNLREIMASRGFEFTQKFQQSKSTASLLDCYARLF